MTIVLEFDLRQDEARHILMPPSHWRPDDCETCLSLVNKGLVQRDGNELTALGMMTKTILETSSPGDPL